MSWREDIDRQFVEDSLAEGRYCPVCPIDLLLSLDPRLIMDPSYLHWHSQDYCSCNHVIVVNSNVFDIRVIEPETMETF